jgi:hypothetical protein
MVRFLLGTDPIFRAVIETVNSKLPAELLTIISEAAKNVRLDVETFGTNFGVVFVAGSEASHGSRGFYGASPVHDLGATFELHVPNGRTAKVQIFGPLAGPDDEYVALDVTLIADQAAVGDIWVADVRVRSALKGAHGRTEA